MADFRIHDVILRNINSVGQLDITSKILKCLTYFTQCSDMVSEHKKDLAFTFILVNHRINILRRT